VKYLGIGDHDAVFIESSLRPMKLKKPHRKVFVYNTADFSSVKTELGDYFESFRDTSQDMSADQTWTTFEQKLKELTDRHIPTKHISNHKTHKSWINRNVKANLRRLKKLYHKQKTSGKQQEEENL